MSRAKGNRMGGIRADPQAISSALASDKLSTVWNDAMNALQRCNEELAEQDVVVESPKGNVIVTMSGTGLVKNIAVLSSSATGEDKAAAVNAALTKVTIL
jgi:DNA-binding protein YbaB